ncbi:MAG: hypothetical protein IJS89_05715 [Bacteroidaceae bacterium]|nr:hypothetical protein [Bacteroidaceae bacterium]
MHDKSPSLPPIPGGNDVGNTPPPVPHHTPAVPAPKHLEEEKPYRRVLRYTIGTVLALFALIGVVTLISFVRNVLMDEQNTVDMQDIQLEQYVVNDPPADTRRSHVRMKPGSHPEAGYIADESVLIREREEDARFREQNGQPATDQSQKPKPTDKPREQEPRQTEHTAQPATPPANATTGNPSGTSVETTPSPAPASPITIE